MADQLKPFSHLPHHYAGYMDYFAGGHNLKEPLVLEDGTSVRFPTDWTDEDADKWRKGHELQRPETFTARTYWH